MTFLPLALTCLVAAQSVGRAGDTPYDPERFELEVLASGMDKPLELAVSPDGRVFIVQQTGEVFCYEPQSGALTLAAKLDVFSEQENGLLGIALDPDFASNNWVYLYYSPSNHMGQFISRFEVHGSQIDLVSEKVVMSWIEQRRECCHHGGSLAFGPDGNLFLSTGDNTNPFDSSGHAPIDDRPEKFPWDARRSSANSMTFGGKVLRIHPTPNGGYQIPAGNLFTDTAKGRPEIYVMGCRNPWRISVDEQTGYLYWGDVGPDASDDGERGPRGYDELNQAKAAGFFGWPLFIGDNFAYRSYDYESESLGAPYDALQPWNNSANNSGMRQLPAAQPAWIYYPYADSEEYPLFESGSRSACAGPVYNFDEGLASAVKFPVEFDEALFVYEWSRHWVNVIHLTGDSEIESVERLPGGFSFRRPADMAFGPEGALYVLEYGTTWGSNDDSQLVRIDYVRGNRKPSARVSASVTAGSAPLEVQLSSEGTADKDGDELEYRWTLQPSGELLSTEANPKLSIQAEGNHTLEFEVRDPLGARSVARLPLAVGNEPPLVEFSSPHVGSFFNFDSPVSYSLSISDLEDGNSEGDADLSWWMDNVFVEAQFVEAGPLRRSGRDTGSFEPLGLAAMKRSDCFNCHAIRGSVVGPALIEVAIRYANEPEALNASMERIRKGSTGVWGESQMLPHAHLGEPELRAMLEWIYALDEDEVQTWMRPGHGGEVLAEELATGEGTSGTLILKGRYTDTGSETANALTGEDQRYLRTFKVEAEHYSRRKGIQLYDSDSASGGNFMGSIDHGNYLVFEDVDLAGISSLRCGVSSAGAGATVEFRSGSPEGELLGTFEMVPNGEWEDWFEVELPIRDPVGLHDLVVVFVNPDSSGGLMNVDWIHFQRK